MARRFCGGVLLLAVVVSVFPLRSAWAGVLSPTRVLLSGDTIRRGNLSEIGAAAGGVLSEAAWASSLDALPIEAGRLYLLNPFEGTATPSSGLGSAVGFGGNAVALFSPSLGTFQIGVMIEPAAEVPRRVIDWSLQPPSTLGEALAEPGSFAVIGPRVLSVPEPGGIATLGMGVFGLVGLSRFGRRPRIERENR